MRSVTVCSTAGLPCSVAGGFLEDIDAPERFCDARAMRPDRSDIAVPPFPPALDWIGGEPPVSERMTARGPMLAAFFEVGELSGVQMLPYLSAWAERYGPSGLTVLGVHTPRSDLARSTARLGAALARLGIAFPVANDLDYRVWHLYGAKGWPSLFLWGRGGVLRWLGLGEEECVRAETAIRTELATGDAERALPEAVGPLRPRDEPGVELVKPSDEAFPGGSHDRAWSPAPGEPLEIEYTGGGCWAAIDGEGAASVSVDGGEPWPLRIEGPGLYRLSEHPRHGLHEVRLELDPSLRVWSVSFPAAPE
jgi:hypothetical protein